VVISPSVLLPVGYAPSSATPELFPAGSRRSAFAASRRFGDRNGIGAAEAELLLAGLAGTRTLDRFAGKIGVCRA
jgi:hypothetical protein